MRTVAKMFADYRQRVIPADAPPIQVQECCRAFYGAVYDTLVSCLMTVGDAGLSEDDGVAALEALKTECEAYALAQSPPPPPLDPARPTHELLYAMGQALPPGSPAQMAVLYGAQVLKRIHDAGYEFRLSNVVSQRTGEGLLDVVWGGFVGQVTPVKAREIAWILLEGASVAESEASVIRFLCERVGIPIEKAQMVLHDFRDYRTHGPESSLVGNKVDG